MNMIGLDVGTTGVKAILVGGNGAIKAQSYREYPLLHPQPGWSELDPKQVFSYILQVLGEVGGRLDKGMPAVIAISSQGQAVVPIDATGNTLYNIIVTMDSRTIPQYEWWKGNVEEWSLYQRTGIPFAAISTTNKIMWHKENQPKIYEQAWKFCCVQDYVVYKLTGEALIDYSLAGRTMLFNPREKAWDEAVLRLAGIDKEKLSTPVPSVTVAGKLHCALAAKLGFPKDIQVVVGGHDQCCGALGTGVNKPGIAMDALGTVDALVVALSGFVADKSLLENHFPCYNFVTANEFVTMAINTNSGLLLKWYRDVFWQGELQAIGKQGTDPYTYIIDRASDNISDVLVLPHLQGANTPISDPKSTAAFVGLRAGTGKEDITRGILESLSYDMRQNILAMEKSGIVINEIRAIGGGAKSKKWLQIKADIFQKPVTTMLVSEAAVLGAAILGGMGTGFFGSLEEALAMLVKPADQYEPNLANKDLYEQRYEDYCLLYPALKKVNHNICGRDNN